MPKQSKTKTDAPKEMKLHRGTVYEIEQNGVRGPVVARVVSTKNGIVKLSQVEAVYEDDGAGEQRLTAIEGEPYDVLQADIRSAKPLTPKEVRDLLPALANDQALARAPDGGEVMGAGPNETIDPPHSAVAATDALVANGAAQTTDDHDVAPAANAATNAKQARSTLAPRADGKLSQMDAAAKVLEESDKPLAAKEIVEQMAAKGLWISPGGKTPHATLSAAIGVDIKAKGEASRFVKTAPGRFWLRTRAYA